MIPRWPSKDLPDHLIMDTFSLSFADNRLQTSMDSGAMKTRRRATRAPRPFSTGTILTTDQYVTLQRFIDRDLAGGVKPFIIRDQVLDGVPLLTEKRQRILDPQGRPILRSAWWLVKFGEKMPALTEAVTDRHYRCPFDLVILP